MGKRRKGRAGRKRKTVVLMPGQPAPEGRAAESRSPGPTPETKRRKELLVGTNNPLFSDSPLGLLFVNGAIDDSTFRAACRYAWLNRALYGHKSLAAVSWDGIRSGGGTDFDDATVHRFRMQLLEAREALDLWDLRRLVDSLVLHEETPPWLRLGFLDPSFLRASRSLQEGLEALRQWYDRDRKKADLPETMEAPYLPASEHVEGEIAGAGTVEAVPFEAETAEPYKPNPVVHEDARTKIGHVRQVLRLDESRAGVEAAAEC